MQRLSRACIQSLLQRNSQKFATSFSSYFIGSIEAATAPQLPTLAARCPASPAALGRQLWRQQWAAGFRTRLPQSVRPHVHSWPGKKSQKSRLGRAASTLGKSLGLAVLAVPLTGVAALVLSGIDDADATQLVLSVPRTFRVVWWGTKAAYGYKSLATRHPNRRSEAYLEELALLHEAAAQELLLVCQSNGGVYIKAGQLAVSLRAVPEQYRRTLEVLQDKVPPRPFEEVDHVIIQELGAPAQEVFFRFEPVATAAASLAQVHKAWLPDGTPVAVKVQYPGLGGKVMADLAGMVGLARAGAWLFPDVNLVWMFEELRRSLSQELDFRNEAQNCRRLAQCMAGKRGVTAPRVMGELSGRRVLCMEWVDGCKVSDEEGIRCMGLSPRDVGLLLLETFADMTFVHGFVHGDPHPGNILVRQDWESQGWLSWLFFGKQPDPQLVLLDHGLYVHLPQEMRQQYCQMWCAFVLNDKSTAIQAATALGGEKAGRILPEVLRPRNWKTVSKEEQRKFREESGVNSFADLGQILEQAPRPLLDTLRLSAVVRHAAAHLGATIADRLRINATAAFKGMELRHGAALAYLGDPRGSGTRNERDDGLTASTVPQDQSQLDGRVCRDGRVDSRKAQVGSKRSWWRRRSESEGDTLGVGVGEHGDGGTREDEPAAVQYYGVLASRSKRWQLLVRLWAMRGAFWLVSLVQGVTDRVAAPPQVLA